MKCIGSFLKCSLLNETPYILGLWGNAPAGILT